MTAINKKKPGDDKSVYNCPVYKYAKRTDKYLIFRVNLNSETETPSKWKLKGVTLLCAKEWSLYNLYIYLLNEDVINIINMKPCKNWKEVIDRVDVSGLDVEKDLKRDTF